MVIKNLTAELKIKYPYGIKAYGSWNLFSSKSEYKSYLCEWMSGTEGSEQSRAVNALASISITPHYDSDAN